MSAISLHAFSFKALFLKFGSVGCQMTGCRSTSVMSFPSTAAYFPILNVYFMREAWTKITETDYIIEATWRKGAQSKRTYNSESLRTVPITVHVTRVEYALFRLRGRVRALCGKTGFLFVILINSFASLL